MSTVVGILYYLAQSGSLNFERLFLLTESTDILVLMYLIIILLVMPMSALRWWLLLRAVGLHLDLKRTYLLTWIGNFFNATIPGSVSGDVVKGYYVIKSQKEVNRSLVIMTLLVDRLVGLFGLVVMAFIALIFNLELIWSQPSLHSLACTIIGLFASIFVFSLIVLYPFADGQDPFVRLFKRLPARFFIIKLYKSFKNYKYKKLTLFYTLLLAIIIHMLVGLIFSQVALMVGLINMELAIQFFLMPAGLIMIAIPIAPGGIGVGHAAFEYLYFLVGHSGGADIFNIVIIVQLSVFIFGGIPYFFYSSEYRVPKKNYLSSNIEN